MIDNDALSEALGALVDERLAAVLPEHRASETVLLPLPEVCQRTRLARSTIYGLIGRGELPVVRVGHRVFVRESELARFIDERENKTAGDGGDAA